jgi:hypothetical protein
MPAPWIIAAGAAGLLFVGGSLASSEVCRTASPGGNGSSVMDMLPNSIEDVVGPAPDWLSPSTTTSAAPSPAKFDVKFSPSYEFGNGVEASCGVELGRMQNLTEAQAACMIASGQYVASGASPSAAAAGKAKPIATKGSKVCSVEKPIWFWLWIPAALLAGLLAILEYSRREEGDPFSPVVEYPESDPDMPAPPVLDPNFRNNTQEK